MEAFWPVVDTLTAKLARSLWDLSHERHTADLEAFAEKQGVSAETLLSVTLALTPLGVVEVSDAREVSVPSEFAADFLKSYSLLIENQSVVVDDWHRKGSECTDPDLLLDRGVCLTRALEARRARRDEAEPIRTFRVAKAIIKAKAADDSPVFLMHRSEDSRRLQFVGGTLRPGEAFDAALRREIIEEIHHVQLEHERDYTYAKLSVEPFRQCFVSPTYGVYSEYLVQYFHLKLMDRFELQDSLRWVTLSELKEGKTRDGVLTLPPPEFVATLFQETLEQLPLSTPQEAIVRIYYKVADSGQNQDELQARADEPHNVQGLDLEKLSVLEVLSSLKLGQLWAVLAALAALLTAVATIAFTLGGLGS